MHAAQNDRLPLRIVIQVMHCETSTLLDLQFQKMTKEKNVSDSVCRASEDEGCNAAERSNKQ